MDNLRVAVLGASGIGKFHVREFVNAKCNVVAILGSSEASSEKTAELLYGEFGVRATPYHNIERLLDYENLDAVSICTPPNLHETQARQSLDRNLNVLCEKPLTLDSQNNYESARQLLDLAEEKEKILTMNTQWVSVIPYFSTYMKHAPLESLAIYMQPGKRRIEMLTDHLPHTNSLLVRFIPKGKATDMQFLLKKDDAINIRFRYDTTGQDCKVEYNFEFRKHRPREIIFSINGQSFVRRIGKNYQQKFVCGKESFDIEDPFKVSINKFVEAVKEESEPLVNKQEILENIYLQEQIINEYMFS